MSVVRPMHLCIGLYSARHKPLTRSLIMLESLYTAPEFAGQGVGAGLLDRLEGLMREHEFRSVRLEASSNARGFYLRRGYRATGPQTPDGAWPVVKEHLA
jgi:putative acetyltransferase